MRLLFQIVSQMVLAAIALVIAHFVLPGFSLHVGGFLTAVGVFTLAHAILGPLVLGLARRYAAPLTGGVGLVATLLALWAASLFRGGIEIGDAQSWVLGSIIVWAITALGGWIFMTFFIDRRLKRRSAEKLLRRDRA